MALRISVPPITRGLLVAQVVLSFLYNLARWRLTTEPSTEPGPSFAPTIPYLTLVPSVCIFYPWTILSATFVEQNIFNLLINGATVFFGGKYLERAWGTRGFLIAVLIAAVVPNLLAVLTYIIWAGATMTSARALTPLAGGIAVQGTFLVAFKQLVPEHTVSLFRGFIKMRVKHFPAVFLALNTISGLLFGTDTALLLAWYGLLTSWVYLRFYKHQPDLSGTSTGSQGSRATQVRLLLLRLSSLMWYNHQSTWSVPKSLTSSAPFDFAHHSPMRRLHQGTNKPPLEVRRACHI